MKGRMALGISLLLLLGFSATSVLADYTLFYSPLNWSTRDPALDVRPASQDAAIRVTSSALEDHCLNFGLTVPSDAEIDAVVICYEMNANTESYISQIRLNEMQIPPTALVRHDDGTDLTNPGPTCYVSDVDPVIRPEGTITLKLRLFFGNLEDWIEIGMIALDISEPVNGLEDDQSLLEGDALRLHPNHPNPFNPATVISYTLDEAGPVEVMIHDVAGRLVRELVREKQEIGLHHIQWDGRGDHGEDLPAGKYFFSVRIGDRAGSGGMVLLR